MGVVRSLGMRRFHSLILALRGGGADAIKTLLPLVPNHAVLRGMLGTMEEEGLIELEVSAAPRKTVSVSLTPLGEKVADLARDADLMVYRGDPDAVKGLDARRAPDVLIMLLDGPANLVEIMTVARSHSTATKALAALEADGLVTVERGRGKDGFRVALTPLGARAAGRLAEARGLMASFNRPG